MLSKLTSKNQLTLPKAVMRQFPGVDYFEVQAQADQIVLKPLRRSRVGDVWEKIDALGITEQDIEEAVQWARSHPAP